MLSLKLEAIIAAVILAVIGALIFTIVMMDKGARKQAEVAAQLQMQVVEQTKTINTIQDDAKAMRANQDALFSSLNDIRVQADKDKNKIVIPAKILHDRDSKALTDLLNKQTKDVLRHFEETGLAKK